jgi:ribosomal-protein-alanine acetyltransferase
MTDDIRLRPALEEDLDSILAVESSWETTPHWTREQFLIELGSQRSLFLVAEGGGISGYAVAWVVEAEAQVLSIAVHPSSTRRGRGRALLRELLERARARGSSVATLEVSELNAAARSLYESEGFQETGRRSRFYPDGSDAVLMDKTL